MDNKRSGVKGLPGKVIIIGVTWVATPQKAAQQICKAVMNKKENSPYN